MAENGKWKYLLDKLFPDDLLEMLGFFLVFLDLFVVLALFIIVMKMFSLTVEIDSLESIIKLLPTN